MLPFQPSPKSSQAILKFYDEAIAQTNATWDMRDYFRNIDLSYLREGDWSEDTWKSYLARKGGDFTKFSNIILPIIMPQVESAVTYQQSVFLSGFPIFGAVASPTFADAATQMDTVIGEQQIRGKWVTNLLRSLKNGFKYNYGPTEVAWEQRTSFALEDAQVGDQVDRQKEVIWQGNLVRSLDPYNTFIDSRVDPTELYEKGEFAGYDELLSRIALKKYLSELPTRINVTQALESSLAATPITGNNGNSYGQYYIPDLNPEIVFGGKRAPYSGTNWLAWASIGDSMNPRINYQNTYKKTVLYGRILPGDFGMNVPGRQTPQVWKFIIINGKVLVYAERLTNVHNYIPVLIARPEDDNLEYQTKPFSKNLEPFQDIATALANSNIHARRRAISDRLLYDPSRITKGAIDNASPIARIPVLPKAYGTPVSDAIYQIPFRDEQSQYNTVTMQQFLSLANAVSGLNPARQGQFVKGNKTRAEFEEIMQFANGRDQTKAITLEGTFFAPMKEIVKLNTLQYQAGVSLYSREENTIVSIDPVKLRQAGVEFKLSDGLQPNEKLVDGESLALAFQTLAASPNLSAGYNLAPMFSYLMKMRGAKLRPFEKSPQQQAYEQAVQAWNQTVMMILEKVVKQYPDAPPEEVQKMLPPQPMPEQFGYTPGAITQGEAKSTTVMDTYLSTEQQVQAAIDKAKQAAQAQAAQQQPA